MSTGNFYYRNTNNIYAVNDDGLEFMDGLENDLKERGVKTCKSFDDIYENRNFPTIKFGYKDLLPKGMRVYNRKTHEYIYFNAYAYIVLRCGYYEGACFDYILEITDGYNTKLDCDIDDFVFNSLNDFGIKEKTTLRARQKITNLINKEVDNLEKMFSEVSTYKLQVSARFSNGETWYSEVKNEN